MDVAIVGMGCRFPGGADSPAAFWALLRDGVDAVGELPPERFDVGDLFDPDPAAPGKMYTRWGGLLERVDRFDADFFGIAPREARRIDPQQRLLLEVVWEALEDGGQIPDQLAGTDAGVFIGISTRDYADVQDLVHNRHRIDAHLNAGIATSIAANRLSYLLDLHGPSLAVDTACSSSLTAVHLACRSLAWDECQVAIAGGVSILLAPEITVGFCKASMLSPDGRCRSFDAGANGYVRSEGAGAVVLKPLERAVADGDPIHAVILGSAINEDGRTTGLSLPSSASQQALLRQALRNAGVEAADIGYVEAHGTGTPAGDPVEAHALGTVLAAGRTPDRPCLMGSAKTNLGHLEAAAGMPGLIKAALVLEHRQVPPNLHFHRPNPAIAFDGLHLRVPTALEPLPVTAARALVGVNSFGFGGANAHVVLAEAPPTPAPPSTPALGPHILTISARGVDGLRELADRHRQHLAQDTSVSLRDVCYTASRRRSHHSDRLTVVARSRAEATEQLEAFLTGERRSGWAVGHRPAGRRPKLAFVFPGMGPQWAGMGRQLLEAEPVFRRTLEEVDALLERLAGWSLLEALDREEGAARVADADRAHVANLAVQVALAQLWRSWGIVPDAVVGHSSGEMAAACVAGALALPDAVELAFHRGRLQHRATGTGRMLAAGIPPEEAVQAIAGCEHEVALAAINAPCSVTLSGDGAALERIAQALAAKGRFTHLLSVDVPYHGPQMDQIRDEFLDAARDLRPRTVSIPLTSSVTGDWVDGGELDAAYWWRNVRNPVHFAAATGRLIADGCEVFIEVGPHPVLGASITECLAVDGSDGVVLPSLRRGDDEPEVVARTLAALHVRGYPVDWAARYPSGTCVTLPAYPWQRERHWFDSDETSPPPPVSSGGVDTGHPLLGRRLPAAQPTWEVHLDSPRTEYLDAHALEDTAPLLPGAGYIEMALAAGRELWGETPTVLDEIQFRKLLFLRSPGHSGVQLSYRTVDGAVEIHSNPAADGTSWTLHTTARLASRTVDPPEVVDLAALRARCGTPLAAEDHYRAFTQRGFRFGPAFHTLGEIRLGRGEAIGRVGFPPGVDLPVEPYRAHPALLDGALQLFGAASATTADLGADAPFFPVSVRRLEFHRPLGRRAWAHAVVRRHDERVIEGDARLVDDAGQVLITMEGLRLQVLDEHRPAAVVDDWLYELRWEQTPPAMGPNGSPLPPVGEIRTAVEAAEAAPQDRTEISCYLDVVNPCLDTVARGFALAALASIGWDPARHHGRPAHSVAEELGVVPAHRRLFAALTARTDAMVAPETAGPPSASGDQATLHNLLDGLIATHPQHAAEAELVRRGGVHLAQVLHGQVDGRELLFDGEALELLTRFYHASPPCRIYHDLLADAVAATARGSVPLRVLEIGAGTGAATATLLDRLPPSTRYVFTDVSPHFLSNARRRFTDRADLRFELLDIEADPGAQGFEPQSFDVVVAANVVHVTADLDVTLGHVSRLLAPGGVFAMLELTLPAEWFNVVFGLLEGWWRSADGHRDATGPMLDTGRWLELLEGNGFDPVTPVFDGPVRGEGPQALVLAQVPAAPEPPPAHARHWLVLVDDAGVGARLADQLGERGDRCSFVVPGDHHRRHEDGTRAVPPTDPAAFQRLLSELASADPIDGVIHLWSLRALTGDPADATALLDEQALGCGSVLALMQALDGMAAPIGELWLVTAGAQPVPGHDAAPNLGQAPLWGLGRVAMSEQAGTRCRLVDLGPDLTADDVAALTAELCGDGADDEVALRRAARFARRLRRSTLADHALRDDGELRSPATHSFRLEVGSPGSIDSLVLREAPVREPGPGEVGIRVMASGLNFRDVLQALDMLPAAAYQYDPDPQGLGIECSGIVIACGPGVTRFRPGDEVITLAAAAHGTRVIARQDLTVAKPSSVSFEEAASILNAFVTAEYALHHVARIRPGERVLIHSATGAVGLASVQLCHRAGIEVFATAGTAEKRSYLRGLGIQHVMDSRSLAFADEVLQATAGEGVDVVVNSLSGEATAKGLAVLRPYGRFVELGKRDIFADAHIGLLPFQRNLSFHAVDLIQLALDRPGQARELLDGVVRQVAEGVMRVVPTTSFDLADAEGAFRLMAQARHIGKVVLTIGDGPYRVRARAGAPLFRPDGTYLITGGLGGFGLAVAQWMAREGAGHIVLMSRTGEPKDNAAALEALRASSAQVTVVQGDVSQADHVRRVLDRIRRELGPLRGVVHAAMVLDDDVLVRLDQQRLRDVLAPKAAGGWNLHQLTRGDDLDLFVLFSSIAAVVGHPMQANYAAANAFLDSLAAHRQARGLPALTIGWGAVGGVGYVARHPELLQYLERGGFRTLAPSQAVALLGDLLRRDFDHVLAAPMDWRKWAELNSLSGASRRFHEFVTQDQDRDRRLADGPDSPLASLASASAEDRRGVLLDYLRGKVAQVLGARSDKIDLGRPLTELGFDSLMAVELTTTLTSHLGVRLPVVDILQGLSTAELADKLLVELTPGAVPAPPGAAGPDAAKVGAARAGEHPLSFEQRRFWVLHQLDPDDGAYNLHGAARLLGPLDLDALQRSLSEIVRRHETLRSTVREVDGEPVQQVAPPRPLGLAVMDLSGERVPDRDLDRLITEAIQRPFDLSRSPVLRACLFRRGQDDHVLLLVVHHIACDAWAMNLLVREIGALYEAFGRGQPSPLPEPALSYFDYVTHQRVRLDEVLYPQLCYWRRQLAGVPAALGLSPGPPRTRGCHRRGGHRRLELPSELTDKLQVLSQREGATLFMTLLAAFQTLLHRYSGAEDICVGTAVSTRGLPGSDMVAGCFLNTLALRCDLSGQPTFRQLLQRVKTTTLAALEHQDVPFDRVVEELQPERPPGRTPFFEAMLVLHNARLPELRVAGLDVRPIDVESGSAVADLVLLLESGERLSGMLEYDADRFDTPTVDRMLDHFRRLLAAAAADPDQPLAGMALLSDAERQRLLVEWNDTSADLGGEACLHQMVEAQVRRSPHATAVVSERSTLTYRQLDQQANQLAHHLRRLGVGPEVVVGVYLPRSPDVVTAALGILKAGGAYLPLDASNPAPRVELMLGDARPAVLITRQDMLDGLPTYQGPIVALDADGPRITEEPLDGPVDVVTPADLAYVIYTSGSTGTPHGVEVSHRAISNQVRWRQGLAPLSADDVVLQRTPLGFDPSIWELFGPLAAGARLLVPGPEPDHDAAALLRLIVEHQVTVLQAVPSLLDALLEAPGITRCRSLRHVFCGGEPMPGDLAARFVSRLPGQLHHLYGPTEAAIDSTHWRCQAGSTAEVVPIGRPIANTRVYVLDDHLQPVPVGVPGELYIGGVGLARGYRSQRKLTRDRFVDDPFAPGHRLYRTGDVARWLPEGSVAFVGRADHQIKVRGSRVEPAEVEAVLRRHPAVREAAVVAPIDDTGARRLRAYVVTGEQVEASDLRRHAAERLPDHMVPSSVVVVDSLPRTSTGKVDRGQLTGRGAPPRPGAPAAPRDPVELQLQRLWQECFGGQRVGTSDDFFELGGHSLLAVQLLARIRRAFAVDLPVSSLLEARTIQQLARLLRAPSERLPPTAVAIQPHGTRRPFFWVHPVAGTVYCYAELARALGTDRPVYGFQAAGLVDGAPHTRIEDMADQYVAELQRIQPTGAYLLGGWSMGGLIAFDMARRLHGGGHAVAMLALVDAAPVGDLSEGDGALVTSFMEHLGLTSDGLDVALGDFWRLGPDEQLACVVRHAQRAGLLAGDGDVPAVRRQLEVFTANLAAVRSYVPSPYAGRLSLFEPDQRVGSVAHRETRWDGLALGGVDRCTVPGDHHTMLSDPHVGTLAQRLAARLDDLERAGP